MLTVDTYCFFNWEGSANVNAIFYTCQLSEGSLFLKVNQTFQSLFSLMPIIRKLAYILKVNKVTFFISFYSESNTKSHQICLATILILEMIKTSSLLLTPLLTRLRISATLRIVNITNKVCSVSAFYLHLSFDLIHYFCSKYLVT